MLKFFQYFSVGLWFMLAINMNSAKILGVADRIRSIEKGKDVDLRILNGYPLNIMSKVEIIVVDGKIVYTAK